MAKLTRKEHLKLWQKYIDKISQANLVNLNESPYEKIKRIKVLKKDFEAWFSYYFPNLTETKDKQH